MELKRDRLLQGGRYRIIESIGRGGFGITYLAEQVMAKRKVCIKEFFPKDYYKRDGDTGALTLSSDGFAESMNKFKAKLVKEAQTIATLNHANIIPIHDVFEENNTAYYVMDYIEGESLSDIVKRRGALTEADSVRYIREAAAALEYIHERTINHLDVKPGNIMVRRDDDRAILIDFGLSKHYDNAGEQTSSTPVGISHGFAPIEQYKQGGVSSFSPTTDIYALGATLYYLVTGSVPPSATDVGEDGLPELPKHLSSSLCRTIEKSMSYWRKDRPQTIKAFVALLDGCGASKMAVADESTVISTVASDDEKTKIVTQQPTPKRESNEDKPKQKRNRLWLWLLLLLLIGGVAYLMFMGGDNAAPISNTTPSDDAESQGQQTQPANFTVTVGNVSFKMIWVEGGSYWMGSPAGVGDDDEHQHKVTLDGYWIAETEVTQGLWRAVMNGKDEGWTTEYGKGSNYPAYNVSYTEAKDFCNKLNELTDNKHGFRLPTEAEWEYAARGGNKSKGYTFSGSDDNIGNVAWYWGNSNGNNGNTYGTHEVKTKSSNELGIYDMSGNVWEWCSDWYGKNYYKESPQKNPKGPSTGVSRVLRGGSWYDSAEYCRVAPRDHRHPFNSFNNIGFRLAVSSSL